MNQTNTRSPQKGKVRGDQCTASSPPGCSAPLRSRPRLLRERVTSLQAGLPGRFTRDGYFSEPGYLGFSDYDRAEYKAAGKVLDDRIKGRQIVTSSDRSGMCEQRSI